jgi:hypothetical protein
MTSTAIDTTPSTSFVELVGDDERSHFTGEIFGFAFPLVVEPNIFLWADKLSNDYHGGFWQFYKILGERPAFFMAPQTGELFNVESPNTWCGEMNARQYGITCCLFTYSNLSFGKAVPGVVCSNQFHLVREWMFDNMDSESITKILGAID